MDKPSRGGQSELRRGSRWCGGGRWVVRWELVGDEDQATTRLPTLPSSPSFHSHQVLRLTLWKLKLCHQRRSSSRSDSEEPPAQPRPRRPPPPRSQVGTPPPRPPRPKQTTPCPKRAVSQAPPRPPSPPPSRQLRRPRLPSRPLERPRRGSQPRRCLGRTGLKFPSRRGRGHPGGPWEKLVRASLGGRA